MNYSNVLEDGEVVLWEGRPRQSRIFAVQDIFVVPFSLLWTAAAVAGAILAPDMPWATKVFTLAIAAYLTVGRFIYKAILKSQTLYLVTDRRALVLRQGDIYEHQELDGVTPEITGWNHNRIVTFGDALESTLTGSGLGWTPGGNLGMPTGRFTVRRGDGSGFPIRFYDLDPAEAERLMSILKERARQPHVALEGGVATTGFPDASDSAEERVRGDVRVDPTGRETDGETTFARWAAASPWRFILLPAVLATVVTARFAALTHSPGDGLFPGIVVGLSSYLVYRRKYGAAQK